MADLQELAQCIIKADEEGASSKIQELIDQGVAPQEILDNGLIAGMDEVGERFRRSEFFIPEVLLSAQAMKAAMGLLEPHLKKTQAKRLGKMVIGTVQGDLHDIGKFLVAIMVEGAGFEVVDLGSDVPPEKFVAAARDMEADIVGMSALLTTTMLSMQETIKQLDAAGLKERVKVLVGGAPVSQDFADRIGADGYAPDAVSAIDKAKGMLGITS